VFNPATYHMGFVVDRVALGQDMLRVLLFHRVVIKTVLHAHSVTTDAIRFHQLRALLNDAIQGSLATSVYRSESRKLVVNCKVSGRWGCCPTVRTAQEFV
jgi:hypothetical protein